jgi:RNAse (barnase) inhibitor barstar|tara:strand:- start:1672 stop:1890 length:219 start_codon:yes stop_codon:yes gene_type:complete
MKILHKESKIKMDYKGRPNGKVWDGTSTQVIKPIDDNDHIETRINIIEKKLDKLINVLSNRQHELTREMKEK